MKLRLLIETIKFIFMRKDDNMMAKIYFNRLLIGTITYDAVPVRYQAKVIAYGRQYVADGKLSEEEFEMIFKEPYSEEE